MDNSVGFLSNDFNHVLSLCGHAKFCVDSREINQGDVFVLLPTFHLDMARVYIKHAISQGAVCIIYERPSDDILHSDHGSVDFIAVDAGYLCCFLQSLAKRYRASLCDKTVIAISGSVGKSSVCHFLSLMLAQKGRVYCSRPHENGQWGVAISVLNTDLCSDFLIFEVGIDRSGQMMVLADMLRPNIALLTSISAQHLENYCSVADIAREKSLLFLIDASNMLRFAFVPATINHKDVILSVASRAPVHTFSATLQPTDLLDDQIRYHVGIEKVWDDEDSVQFEVCFDRLCRKDQIENQISALVIFHALFPSSKLPCLSHPVTQLAVSRRMEHFYHAHGHLIIDDSWNASFLSTFALIDYLQCDRFKSSALFFVFGGICELGNDRLSIYQALAEKIMDNTNWVLICIGPNAFDLYSMVKGLKKIYFQSIDDYVQNSIFENALMCKKTAVFALKASHDQKFHLIRLAMLACHQRS